MATNSTEEALRQRVLKRLHAARTALFDAPETEEWERVSGSLEDTLQLIYDMDGGE